MRALCHARAVAGRPSGCAVGMAGAVRGQERRAARGFSTEGVIEPSAEPAQQLRVDVGNQAVPAKACRSRIGEDPAFHEP